MRCYDDVERGFAMTIGVETLPQAYLLTWQDWLESPQRDGCRYELLGGEIHMWPTPSTRHQRISRDLMFLLETYLRRTGHGELFHAGMGVRLSQHDVVMPDLLVVLTARRALIEDHGLGGAPDLVVEILSPGTARRDLGEKRALYEHHGVREYWIVDPIGEKVVAYVLIDGMFRFHGEFGRTERLRSAILPDLEIPLDEVFPKA